MTRSMLRHPIASLLENSKTISQVTQIHAQLIITGLISNTIAASRLIVASAISNFADMNYAQLVFSQIREPNIFIWNTVIRGHIASSDPKNALFFYSRMHRQGVWPDNYTFPFVLKACGLVLAPREGKQIHGQIINHGLQSNLFVRNAMICMYARCGEIVFARQVFDELPLRDLASWNSMIAGYVGSREMEAAQQLFEQMPERDVFSWSIMIDGYGKVCGNVDRARNLFDQMPVRDLVSWNSMIDVYRIIGDMIAARQLFDEMPERNVISWSIIIDGYVRYGQSKEALDLFQKMLLGGEKPDKVSVVGAISACAQLGALDQGRWVHLYIERNKILLDIVIQTALVDMYIKCGDLDLAREMFKNMPQRNVVSWNVMITGLGINGCGEEAIELFIEMKRQGIVADDLSFLGVLIACSHAGLVSQGLRIFEMMKRVHRIEPKMEHYGSLIDLLGRAGLLNEAKTVIERIPMRPNSVLWGSFLAACRIHGCLELANFSVDQLAEIGADDCGVYVLLSNSYAAQGMWKEVLRIRKLMSDRRMKKEIGRSVIEIKGEIHEFVNGDISHFLTDEIYLLLGKLSQKLTSAGYAPCSELSVFDFEKR